MEQLQTELMSMKIEQQEQQKKDAEKREVEEIKNIQHNSKMQELKERMNRTMREQNDNENKVKSLQMKAEKDSIQHRIKMEKMEQSLNKLLAKNVEKIGAELNVENGGLDKKQLAEICNITEEEAADIIDKFDIDGDGKLDFEEFQFVKSHIAAFQKEQKKKNKSRQSRIKYDALASKWRKKVEERQKIDKQRKELLQLNTNQLVDKCQELNLATNGNKGDLVARIMDAAENDK